MRPHLVRVRRKPSARRSTRRVLSVESMELRATVSDSFLSLVSGVGAIPMPAVGASEAVLKVEAAPARARPSLLDSWTPSAAAPGTVPSAAGRATATAVVAHPAHGADEPSTSDDDWLTLVDIPGSQGQGPAASLSRVDRDSDPGRGPGGEGGEVALAAPDGEALPPAASQPAAQVVGSDLDAATGVGSPAVQLSIAPQTAEAASFSGGAANTQQGEPTVITTDDSPASAGEGSSSDRGAISPVVAPQPAAGAPVLAATPAPSGGTVHAQRIAGGPAENLFPVKYAEHFDVTSTFRFKLVNNLVTTNRPVSWQIWDDGNTFDTLLSSGSGAQFDFQFLPGAHEGWVYVTFWEDVNLNGTFDGGDESVSSPAFWVQQRKRYIINVDVSSAIPGTFASTVQSRLIGARNLLLQKDSANDWRACVSFEAGTNTTFPATPAGGARPDPVLNQEAERLKHWNAPADIVFVNQLFGAGGWTNPATWSWHDIIIDWDAGNTAWLEAAIAHEIGHGVGLQHNGTSSPWLMKSTVLDGTVDREVTQSQADTFD